MSSLEGALTTDVTSEVKIAFDNAADIFYGSKAQAYIRENTMKAIKKELGKMNPVKLKF